jgi:hypothetical protein
VDALATQDERRLKRTAKACGPGAPTLALTQLSQLDLVFDDFRCLAEAKAESLQWAGGRKSL